MKILFLFLLSLFLIPEASAQCWQICDMNHNDHSLIVRHDGTLWARGRNNNGAVGDSTFITPYTFVQVGSDTNWVSAYAGRFHSTAIKSDGTVWTWGANYYGTYGDGTLTDYNYPKYSHVAHDWGQFYPGSNQNFVIKQDGTLWGWGDNTEGELGDGSGNHYYSPKQIGTSNAWRSLSPGFHHVLGIQEDRTLWAWGANGWDNSGALGDSTLPDHTYWPRKIGSDADWYAVAGGFFFSVALKTNGTLWTTGMNNSGQLGTGTSGTGRRHFAQVGTDRWRKISAGKHHVIALKTDGTLWGWGLNSDGQLGNGTYEDASTPTQIGKSDEWVDIETGNNHSIAQKSDGSLWTWGINGSSQFARVNVPQKIQCNDPNYVYVPPVTDTTTAGAPTITIFPNPALDVIYISSSSDSPINEVRVISPTGQIVMIKSEGTGQLNIEHLERGTYFLQIFQNTKSSGHKFVKM